MIHFLLPRESDFTVREYLERRGRDMAARVSILHYEDLPTSRTLPEGTYVLAALDQIYPRDRPVLGQLCDLLVRSGLPVRVLNAPESVRLRLGLLEELDRQGLNRHRARRADNDLLGLRFPVFLREEHRHTGALTPLLETPAQVEAALARLILRGHPLKDLLIVEFFDSSDQDGYFRKYAAFAVGPEIIPRSFSRGLKWMLKFSASEFTPSMLAEERDYVLENPHERELRRIFELARIDYGRIDYAVKDGVIETWEINTNPVIGHGPRSSTGGIPDELRPLREEAKGHFYRRFRAALEAIDVGREAPRRVELGEATGSIWPRRLITRDEHSVGRRLALRKLLRPLRPFLDRIAGAVSPILVKVARWVE